MPTSGKVDLKIRWLCSVRSQLSFLVSLFSPSPPMPPPPFLLFFEDLCTPMHFPTNACIIVWYGNNTTKLSAEGILVFKGTPVNVLLQDYDNSFLMLFFPTQEFNNLDEV